MFPLASWEYLQIGLLRWFWFYLWGWDRVRAIWNIGKDLKGSTILLCKGRGWLAKGYETVSFHVANYRSPPG